MRRAALLLAVALAPRVAAAGDDQAAKNLYELATKEMDQKRYDLACPHLVEVTRLVPGGLGAKLTLAQCWESAGKLASAHAAYVDLEAAAGVAGDAARKAKARKALDELEPKVSLVTLALAPEVQRVAGLAVTLDGAAWASADWSKPRAVEPGAHVVRASAPGRVPYEGRVTLSAVPARVEVKILELPLETAAPPAKDPPAPEKRPEPRPAPREEGPPLHPAFVTGLGLGGLGVVLGGVAVGLGVGALDKFSQSNAGPCDAASNRCDGTGLALRRDAIALGDGSTGVFVAAGLSLAIGAVLAISYAPRKGASESASFGAWRFR